MARPKGSPKTGGRQKGTPNKKSHHLNEIFIENGIDIGDELVRLYQASKSNSDKLQILYKILDYIFPKRKSIDHIVTETKNNDEHRYDLSKLSIEELQVLKKINSKIGI